MYETGYRSLIKTIFLLLLIPVACVVIKQSVAYVSGPTLYEGDRLESRKCRECDGAGKDEELARDYPQLGTSCQACGGKGMVDVVLPGPKRPTRVWGVVVDAGMADDLAGFSCPGNIKMLPVQSAFLPVEQREIRGGVSGVKITFEREGAETLQAQSDATGRFTHKLPPGPYKVKAEASGFAALEGKLEIEPLTAPIWLERANIIRELEWEEGRSANGLALVVAVTRPDERGAYVRVYAVPP